MSHTPPAPRHRLADLREWLTDRIDGSEETRGEDSLISGFIAQIDALDDQIVGLTRPKTIAEWQAAKAPTPASKTQQKRFAAQSEPRGCPTPGACSAVTAVAEQTRLRRMAEHERDAMLEELIAARSATGAPVAWMYEESGERMFGHPDGYRPLGAVPLYAGSLPVEETAIGHALNTLDIIANWGDEENEWDAVVKYRSVRDRAATRVAILRSPMKGERSGDASQPSPTTKEQPK